jgi:hypothetical protein
MADDKRVVSLVRTDVDELAGAVDEFRRKLPAMIEHHGLVAKLQRAAYEHYLAEGFTAKQALELAKTIR